MNLSNASHYCPCCGYPDLIVAPYSDYMGPPISIEILPPYFYTMGEPSYEICSYCGYEFGNDDEPGTSEPISFRDYLIQWIKDGCIWFGANLKPENWSLGKQLEAAGISNPIEQ